MHKLVYALFAFAGIMASAFSQSPQAHAQPALETVVTQSTAPSLLFFGDAIAQGDNPTLLAQHYSHRSHASHSSHSSHYSHYSSRY